MASWNEVADAEPEFAQRVQALFDAQRHKTMATLRKDGSPRISGIEAQFIKGDVWLGMMGGSMKALDLLRDPRLALHSATVDPPEDPTAWPGEAKLAGRAEEVTDQAIIAAVAAQSGQEPPAGPFHLFRIDVTEVVMTRVSDPPDHLVIELWREGQGVRRFERK
jgi:Pyridoxamine 5'-phosphate oxidase